MFIEKELINNRTGAWYAGVMSLSPGVDLDTVVGNDTMATCESVGMSKEWFSDDFGITEYGLQSYTQGCYSFNTSTEVWESVGVTVINTTKLISGCGVSHLTSFGSGWFPAVNTIDFEFVFAAASFQVITCRVHTQGKFFNGYPSNYIKAKISFHLHLVMPRLYL